MSDEPTEYRYTTAHNYGAFPLVTLSEKLQSKVRAILERRCAINPGAYANVAADIGINTMTLLRAASNCPVPRHIWRDIDAWTAAQPDPKELS